MTAFQLRPVVEGDRETLYRIYASTRTEELSMVPWNADEKEQFLRMQFHAQTVHYDKNYPQAQFQMILMDDQVAGRLYVDRVGKLIQIIDIALFPEFRGQGIGTAILKDLIAESAQSQMPLQIHVEKNNPAKRLYKRLGFVEVGDAGVYDLMERPV